MFVEGYDFGPVLKEEVPIQVARFKRQKAAESKLQEIKERRERRRRSTQAAAKTSNVEHGEEDLPDEDDEEEREVFKFDLPLQKLSLKCIQCLSGTSFCLCNFE